MHVVNPTARGDSTASRICLLGCSGSVVQPFRKASTSGPVVQSLTNADKLLLPANTPVGTRVDVTDGFYLSGFGDVTDGYWYQEGTLNGKPFYRKHGLINDSSVAYDSGRWFIYAGDDGGSVENAASGNEASPWLASWPTALFINPAPQILVAPSTALGGVFVSGGTQDGIYIRLQGAPKDRFILLGAVEDFSIFWHVALALWIIADGKSGEALYYSSSNVAAPDLASDWLDTNDNPASITVTAITLGELNAGVSVAGSAQSSVNVPHVVDPTGANGFPEGRFYYVPLTGNNDGLSVNVGFWSWAGDPGSVDAPAFPWEADWSPNASVPTVARNDVASEANWQPAP